MVTQGTPVTFNFYHAAVDMYNMTFNTNETAPPTEVPVYICNTNSLLSGDITYWSSLGTTTNKAITINTTTLSPGTYIVATPGWASTTIYDIACAPGGMMLTVLPSQN